MIQGAPVALPQVGGRRENSSNAAIALAAYTRDGPPVKAFFGDCAGALRGQGDVKGAERLAKAGTHWMRHSHASHAIAGGMPIEIAQQNLGHASLATTTVYVTTEKRRRMKAVDAFWKR